MKQGEVSKEQFAKWSFERDRSVGLFDEDDEWNTLDAEEREEYLDEAEYYLTKHPKDDWPEDILERLSK